MGLSLLATAPPAFGQEFVVTCPGHLQPLVSELARAHARTVKGLKIEVRPGEGLEVFDAGAAAMGFCWTDQCAPALAVYQKKGGLAVSDLAVEVLAAVVNPGNPVDRLTESQLKDVFTGAQGSWEELGGPPGPVVLFVPAPGSAAYESMAETILDGQPPRPDAKPVKSSTELIRAVAGEPAALAVIGLGDLTPDLKVLELGPIRPTLTAADQGLYSLTRRLVAVHASTPGPVPAAFLEFIKKPESLLILEQRGLAPVR